MEILEVKRSKRSRIFKKYKPTQATHKHYQFSDVDGIVGKNIIIYLYEADNENWKCNEDYSFCCVFLFVGGTR